MVTVYLIATRSLSTQETVQNDKEKNDQNHQKR